MNDGGPVKGGELVIAINPELVAGADWRDHSEAFIKKLSALEGVRLPGDRRHHNREDRGKRSIHADLLQKIRPYASG